LDPDKPYVGYKNTPLHTRFKPGQSGNPDGRPKGQSKDLVSFGDLLMKEFYKTVPANLGGKTVNKTQGQIVAMKMVTNAINKGPVAMNLLLKFIENHEARQARREELLLRKQAEGASEIDWDAEKQELYERLCRVTGVQPTPPKNEESNG
jgi:hypothetical protein